MIESNQRIEAALAQLGAEYEPPLGWEARVLAATRARRPWWWYAMPGFAVTALAVCAVALWPTAAPPALALSVEVQHPAPVRGREGQVGDTVRITATGGDGERAIWVYRDEQQLVLRCPGASSCAASPSGIQVDFVPRQVGTYTIVALTGQRLPLPAGAYDNDTAAARRAGIMFREDKLTVR